MKTYIVVQAIEVEAESETDAVTRLGEIATWKFPYYVLEADDFTRTGVHVALVGSVEVSA